MVCDSPLISIVVPVYNVEVYLRQCIESIVGQTYKNLQIILVNDGSTDKSAQICKKYAENDCRIEVITQSNQGISAARNAGIEQVQGQYICFVDSDDFIDAQYVEVLYNNIQSADMVICNATFYNTSDPLESLTSKDLVNIPRKSFSKEELIGNIHCFKRPLVIVPWNKLYRVEVWKDLRYPVGLVHEDEYIIHHIIDRCQSIEFIDIPLYYYRQSVENSVMSSFSRNRFNDFLKALDNREKFFVSKGLIEEAKVVGNLKKSYFYKQTIKLEGNDANSVNLMDIINDQDLFKKRRLELCISILAKRLFL